MFKRGGKENQGDPCEMGSLVEVGRTLSTALIVCEKERTLKEN